MTRRLLRLLLACTALAAASPTAAQPLPALVPETGSPLGFRISLPEGWKREARDGMLSLTADDHAMVIITTKDVLAGMDIASLPIPEAEARRRLTARLIQSDSALYDLLDKAALRNQQGVEPGSMTRGIRTLAGERAGYVQMRIVHGDAAMEFQFHVTAKDGIVYVVMTGAPPALAARYAPLFEQIRASLVLTPSPAG